MIYTIKMCFYKKKMYSTFVENAFYLKRSYQNTQKFNLNELFIVSTNVPSLTNARIEFHLFYYHVILLILKT